MKFLVLTAYDDTYYEGASFKSINDVTEESKRKYCQKHGYDYLSISKTLDSGRVISWSKTKAAIDSLDKYDWIWCTDADLIIMDDDVSLESKIDNNFDIVVAQNLKCDKPGIIEINTGSILIKNSSWTKDFLNDVYAQSQFAQERWAEQAAMMHLLLTKPEYQSHFKFVSWREFNSAYRQHPEYLYQKGDFVLHMCGCGNLERLNILKSIEQCPQKTDWEIKMLKKDRKISPYFKEIHYGEDPYSGIEIGNWLPTNDFGGLHPKIFDYVWLNAGGDAVNLIVEVGSWLGGSSLIMSRELKRKNNIHTDIICIDTWDGSLVHWLDPNFRKVMKMKNGRPTLYEQFVKNVLYNKVEDYIIPFSVSSNDGAKYLVAKGIKSDIVFIDASHEEEDVYNDIIHHWQHLRSGGIMFGDDYEPAYPGVQNAVHRFANENNLQVMVTHLCNEWIIKKP